MFIWNLVATAFRRKGGAKQKAPTISGPMPISFIEADRKAVLSRIAAEASLPKAPVQCSIAAPIAAPPSPAGAVHNIQPVVAASLNKQTLTTERTYKMAAGTGLDYVWLFEETVKEEMRKTGLPKHEATAAVCRRDPGLRDKYVEQYNARAKQRQHR